MTGNDTGDARVQRLQRPDGNTVAYATTSGRMPTVAFLGGFRSDMTGTKAMALENWARRTGRAFVRFDYLGHGQSSGRFEDGTIGRWLDDSLAVLDQLTEGKLVLVGSSMGGWLSLLAARARPERLAGLVLIAAAPALLLGLLLLWAWRRIRKPSTRWRPLAMAAGGLMMVAGLGAGLFTASMILRLIGAAFVGAAAVGSVALVSLVAGACAAVMTAGLFVGGLWLFRS